MKEPLTENLSNSRWLAKASSKLLLSPKVNIRA
jgi:hypothetical protein